MKELTRPGEKGGRDKGQCFKTQAKPRMNRTWVTKPLEKRKDKQEKREG